MSSFWPNQIDYFEAVQWPSRSFADAELQAAHVTTDALGMPQPYSGNFASVYRFDAVAGQRSWAVKCFTRPVARPNVRYAEISRFLKQARLPITIEFTYLEQGILVRGEWFPIVKMEWIEGQTLRQFVEDRLDEPRSLKFTLKQLSELWLKVESWLRQAGLAHGDLQHGNLLLVPHEQENVAMLKLIDYDGMWTPGLTNHPPEEFGHQSFQHPHRERDQVYSPNIDRFPFLVIACALTCLSRPGRRSLWDRYDNGDNLLFTKQDFESPASSMLLRELWESGDFELQTCAGNIALASRDGFDRTPLLVEIIENGRMQYLTEEAFRDARKLLYSTETISPSVRIGSDRGISDGKLTNYEQVAVFDDAAETSLADWMQPTQDRTLPSTFDVKPTSVPQTNDGVTEWPGANTTDTIGFISNLRFVVSQPRNAAILSILVGAIAAWLVLWLPNSRSTTEPNGISKPEHRKPHEHRR